MTTRVNLNYLLICGKQLSSLIILLMTINNSDDLISTLVANGYAIIDQALPNDEITKLRNEAISIKKIGLMRRAGTGKNPNPESLSLVRGDFTYWLDADNETSYLHYMKNLRVLLNQTLFLGLFDFETHFSIYPVGAGYCKHLDQLQPNNNESNSSGQRKISTILYLNENWQANDGGQLRLYLDSELGSSNYIDIEPVGGRMVVFLSNHFWHEVLPAKQERMSLTGWFRTR